MVDARRFIWSALRALPRHPRTVARAVGWYLIGKRVRAGNILSRRCGVAPWMSEEPNYQDWIGARERIDSVLREALVREAGTWEEPPVIAMVMPVYRPRPDHLRRAIASVRGQIYPHWELHIGVDGPQEAAVETLLDEMASADPRVRVWRLPRRTGIAGATNAALERVEAGFTGFIDQDDELSLQATLAVARAIVGFPDARILYSDEDKLDADGKRHSPHFKPAWNRELFLAQNYINHLCVIRSDDVRSVGGLREGLEGSQDHDLLLRLLDRVGDDQIVHLPQVLYHWRNYRGAGTFSETGRDRADAARLRAIQDYLDRHEPGAEAVPGPFGYARVRRPLPAPPPRVSLVVPTRDRLALVRRCVDGLLRETDYPDREVILVDNGSEQDETREWLEQISRHPDVQVLHLPGRFNFSALNNRAVGRATGELVCLVNNDIEVLAPEWLREMAVYAVRPGIGAVGARLLYGRQGGGRVQHAGTILGIGGVAGHSHKYFDPELPGYFCRPHLPQLISAVTAACLLVGRDKYLEVGGFDEEHLQVAFNDVDFCLKLGEHGYRNVYTPYATLIHHESLSRGSDLRKMNKTRYKREADYMRRRWGRVLLTDPYYNPNLTQLHENFGLAEEQELNATHPSRFAARRVRP